MSIIADALKKAEKDKLHFKEAPLAPKIGRQPIQEGSPKSPPLTLFLIIGILLVVGALGAFFTVSGKKGHPLDKTKVAAQSAAPQPLSEVSQPVPQTPRDQQNIAESQAAPPQPSQDITAVRPRESSLALTGIMYDPTHRTRSFALINNQILTEGDTINDAKITRIDPDSVSLLVDNEEVVLRLSK